MNETTELLFQIFVGLVCVALVVLIVLLLSRLTPKRLSALGTLKAIIWDHTTYKVAALAIVYELGELYLAGQPIDKMIVLNAIFAATIRKSVGDVKKKQVEATEAASEAAGLAELTRQTVVQRVQRSPEVAAVPPPEVPEPVLRSGPGGPRFDPTISWPKK